jgi:hypothetical protein
MRGTVNFFNGRRNAIGGCARHWGMRPVIVCLAIVTLASCSKPTPSTQQADGAPAQTAPATTAPAVTPVQPAPVRVTPAPEPVTLATGTPLPVRTTSTISSKTHAAGTLITATLDGPLMKGNRIIAPDGSRVEGVVSSVDAGGKVKGRATLAVRLTSLTLANGQTVDLRTSSYGVQARGTKKKDAMKVGIGAGVGAAIGAIAGGGKGAAIGAGAGGGAGTGVVLATRGEPAVIPAESRIRFTLTAPVQIP